MSELFLAVINMSISASWIVLAVFVLRLLLKKAPKWIAVLLWAVVALRLICPFTMESDLSMIPSAQTVSPTIMTDTYPRIHTGLPVFNNSVNPVLAETFSPETGDNGNSLQIWIPVLSVLWTVGMGALILYGVISYLQLKRKVGEAVLLRDRVYQSEFVASPFVLGVFRPKIYLPFAIADGDIPHVLAHEKAHIARKDHWWKPLGFAILAIHWFNPLMWLSYVLLCRDIELACDEKVVRNLDIEGRADYSQALLHCAVGRRMILACPVAFGEVSVKDRIKSVLSYKKPAFWILLVGLIASVVLSVCFLTDPVSDTEKEEYVPVESSTSSAAYGDYPKAGGNSLSIITELVFDIDDDGREEYCVLHYGPTSGVFTFTFSVLEGERLEYFNIFRTEHGDLYFVSPAMSSQRYPKPNLMWDGRNGTFYMDCSVEDGNIVLSCDEQEVTYWGEQGIDSYRASDMWGHLWMITPIRTVVGNLRDYYETTDGTWYFGGQIYKHRLVITGRMPNAVADTTYVYLSNIEDISFERAMWASGLSSSLEQYFSPEEAVLVELHTGEPTLEEISISYNRGQFTYSYIIKDAKGAILCEEKNATREPEILRTGLDIYGLCTQAGTGRSTNYAVFYDLENGRISEPFYYVLTALREYVIYVDLQEGRHFIVVENIFDPSAYSEKYELTNPSPVAADIVTFWSYAGINNNGVSITYLSGENYTETELFIDIP